MKVLSTAILLAVFLHTASAFTTPTVKETISSKNELYSAIQKIVEYPEKGISLAKSGYVTTTFKVEKDGSVKVKELGGEIALKKDVKNQIEKISIKNNELYGKYYEIKIYFDFQEQ